jgi:hypothetical protein
MIMTPKPHVEQSLQEEQIQKALNARNTTFTMTNAICDNPQSGERILGRSTFASVAESSSGVSRRVSTLSEFLGNGDLWITEYTITYQRETAHTMSIMEFRNGKVLHDTQYFADPFEAPAWRARWVQRIEWRSLGWDSAVTGGWTFPTLMKPVSMSFILAAGLTAPSIQVRTIKLGILGEDYLAQGSQQP